MDLSMSRLRQFRAGLILLALVCGAGLWLSAQHEQHPEKKMAPPEKPLALPEETHLRNVVQLTFEGENAEAYFSADGHWLIYQSAGPGVPCDQIYIIPAEPRMVLPRRVSTGQGKSTCAYFFPDGERILFSSTHLAGPECPPRPDYSRGYVWPVYAGYDIFTARPDGSELKQLTDNGNYDAEATISPDGRRIVFTSMRDGDLEIYVMDADGRNVKRLTHELGYDGGAFFSLDGTKIVYRGHHPSDPAEVEDYKALLAQGLLRPTKLEIWVMDADGSNKRQVTSNGKANFAPFWHPDGKRIIFSSNMATGDVRSRNFDLYLINDDGTGLERVTFSPEFDGFPMFSPNGRKLVFASNRNSKVRGETNIFLADWVE
jgi:Tol biopolymer transport system component